MRDHSGQCPVQYLENRDLKIRGRKARTGTAVDAGNFRGFRCVVKNKMPKIYIFRSERL